MYQRKKDGLYHDPTTGRTWEHQGYATRIHWNPNMLTFLRRDMAYAGRQERAFARGERRRKRGRREGDLLLLQSVIKGENNLRRNLRACDEAVEAEKRLDERVREKNENENENDNADKA